MCKISMVTSTDSYSSYNKVENVAVDNQHNLVYNLDNVTSTFKVNVST